MGSHGFQSSARFGVIQFNSFISLLNSHCVILGDSMKFLELLLVIFTFTSSTSTLKTTAALNWSPRLTLCITIFQASPQCGVLVQRLIHFRRRLQFEIDVLQVQIRRLHRRAVTTGAVEMFLADVRRQFTKLKGHFKHLKASLSKYSRKLSHTFRRMRRQHWFDIVITRISTLHCTWVLCSPHYCTNWIACRIEPRRVKGQHEQVNKCK